MPFTKGLDVIQQAQSGTGKTATFCAGILNNIDYNSNECQALVLAPTRELAQQIEKVMRALGDFLQVRGRTGRNGGKEGVQSAGAVHRLQRWGLWQHKRRIGRDCAATCNGIFTSFAHPLLGIQVKCHACVGGTSVREDARILGAGVQVVVGTPGRVFDMLRRRYLRADSIKMFTLDEADEMLSRGFKDQIYDIFQLLPPKLQVSRLPALHGLGLSLAIACRNLRGRRGIGRRRD